MTQEFGVYDPATAKEIKRRVMGNDRVSPNDYSTARDQKLENEYYAVVTADADPATNPLTGFREVVVRLLQYDDYSARSMKLVTGTTGLVTVIHRFEGVSLEQGTLVTIKKFREEWKFDSVDCEPSTALIDALDAL
jgi:hypothetical protein